MMRDSFLDLTITDVRSAHRLLTSPVGITTNRHNRERWAIVLKIGGKTIYTTNGKQIISDRLHPAVLPKGCSYSWTCTEPGECMIIEFDAAETASNILTYNISDNNFIINTFAKIEKSLGQQNQLCKLECKHLIFGILLFLAKSEKKEYVSKDKHLLLQPAIDYIAENYYDSQITNDFLANLCGISTVYFRKTFESVYDISPIKYLHNFRINKAKAILLSDYESVNQIAESIGYSSIYHFSKMFKLYTGVSPSEYAKASRN